MRVTQKERKNGRRAFIEPACRNVCVCDR